MSIKDEVIIGKKGEILPKKQLRERAGFHPGDKVIIMAYPGELVIKKVYSIKELFDLPFNSSMFMKFFFTSFIIKSSNSCGNSFKIHFLFQFT